MSGTDAVSDTSLVSDRTIQLSDLSLRVVEEGDGEPVLLLHGFPDSADLWRNQIPALAQAGFRVVAPDLRGFGESDKPQDVEAYSAGRILADIAGIMDATGLEEAHVVGHDWGAGFAWAVAGMLPELAPSRLSTTTLRNSCNASRMRSLRSFCSAPAREICWMRSETASTASAMIPLSLLCSCVERLTSCPS